ncbi:LPS export ABC transporter periplasmic protein LptC [Sinorhizobium medicae]|uniref:LPS export ABC transporter periplasmic protein LptC n=1 Tax=Sinorhizobium medicae TaxID=110321 RepID=UPI000C7B041E|nr:LPS export ABC transporter periplasmic protein LptC [Sinorhizobium medicae]MDX0515727.1 LPS export ABC transporter periplasmic protein LptC [Sinorhizobium medicae]MDX0725089.1 LPS export ABC transporter periplasmic protein LptC [Sinorhizobium medicae]MDX0731075.1 LPS export ABC transporter periplasmic protein LptC [Sinorhizobium medicae]MDX0811080.1 LPS export ABC transporter periplasmic protein LptC [Sinorhizobium medicae]MDX1099740.1 LPS export ABC transporter periplasmic protein LptC [Si
MLNEARFPATFAESGTSSADAYASAARHSARVKRLKVILPLIAGLIALVFAAVSFVRAFLPEELQLETATIENGKIVMQNPAISGRNKQDISYSMKAQRALQDIANPNIITLETIHAEMPVNDTLIATVDAQSGVYDRGANTLDMNAPFTISMNNGVIADFQSAYLDINAGEMETKHPIAISMTGASIIAQKLRMTDKGRVVTFEGMVRVNIEPSAIRKTAK